MWSLASLLIFIFTVASPFAGGMTLNFMGRKGAPSPSSHMQESSSSMSPPPNLIKEFSDSQAVFLAPWSIAFIKRCAKITRNSETFVRLFELGMNNVHALCTSFQEKFNSVESGSSRLLAEFENSLVQTQRILEEAEKSIDSEQFQELSLLASHFNIILEAIQNDIAAHPDILLQMPTVLLPRSRITVSEFSQSYGERIHGDSVNATRLVSDFLSFLYHEYLTTTMIAIDGSKVFISDFSQRMTLKENKILMSLFFLDRLRTMTQQGDGKKKKRKIMVDGKMVDGKMKDGIVKTLKILHEIPMKASVNDLSEFFSLHVKEE